MGVDSIMPLNSRIATGKSRTKLVVVGISTMQTHTIITLCERTTLSPTTTAVCKPYTMSSFLR